MSAAAGRCSLAFAVLSILLTFGGPAGAEQESNLTPEMLAEKLFHESKAAIAAGRLSEACEKLEDSHHLDPAGGTVLLLASCLERLGKLASAWTKYQEALAFALRDDRRDRASRAREQAAALEPRLPKLKLEVPAVVEGLALQLDGTELPRSAWRSDVPIDPGPHELAASAPERRPWSAEVEGRAGQVTYVTVPELAVEPAPIVEHEARPAHRDAGIITLALGGATMVAGTIAGVTALRWDNRADSACPRSPCDDRNAVATSRQASRAARMSTIGLALGGGLAAGGAVLLWTSRSRGGSTEAAVQWSGTF